MEDINITDYENRIKILEKARTDLYNAINTINESIDECHYKISELRSQKI